LTTNDAKLIELLKKQIEVEKRALETIAKAEDESQETAVKLVFMQMRLDTWKHQKFLEGMIDMLTQTPCDEWSAKVGRYTGRIQLERHFEALMKDEGEMVELSSKALDLIDDPFAQHLLLHLKEEEEKHTKALEKMITLVKQTPLQSRKAEKGTDIVCETD
jgi:rubrerythrin